MGNPSGPGAVIAFISITALSTFSIVKVAISFFFVSSMLRLFLVQRSSYNSMVPLSSFPNNFL